MDSSRASELPKKTAPPRGVSSQGISGPRKLAGVLASVVAAVSVSPGLAAATVQTAPQTLKAEPTLKDTNTQIADLQKKMSIATEDFNQARAKVSESQAKLTKLQPGVQTRRAEVAKHQAEVDKLAGLIYGQGNIDPMSVVAASKNASTTIDQFSMLKMIQDDRKAKVRQLNKAKQSLDNQEKAISAELKDREKQLKVIQERQTTITKDLAKLQELKDKITGVVKDVVGRVAYAGQGAGNAALAIQYALAQQGKSYVWGSTGPRTFDCSGLTMRAWQQGGVSLEHSSRQQYKQVTKVARSSIQAGDLVFYGGSAATIHHVALYIGGGQVVHAPESGDVVKVASIDGAGDRVFAVGRP